MLRSYVEASWRPPVYYETREAESAAAAEVLGCEYQQWGFPDSVPPWPAVREALEGLRVRHVFAPLPEAGGHPHHNAIGRLCASVFREVTYYATYTHAYGKTTTGTRVKPRKGWEERKRRAMACYVSQATHPQCAVAFSEWPIDEYLS